MSDACVPEGAGGEIWAVIVTYHRLESLRSVLASLAGQTRRPEHLLIVDNGSDADVAELASSTGADYLDTGDNLGPAGGIAAGMERVLTACGDSDWILLVDDDDPAADERYVSALYAMAQDLAVREAKLAGVGLVGARYEPGRGRFARVANRELSGAVPVDYVGGGQFPLYRVAAVRSVGVFDRSLFFGFEEAEFGLRLKSAGWRLFAHGDLWRAARVKHGRMDIVPGDPRLRTARETAAWRRYYSARNSTRLAAAHGSPRAVVLAGARAGVGGAVQLLRARQPASEVLLPLRGVVDGLMGRMGRTIEPGSLAAKRVAPK